MRSRGSTLLSGCDGSASSEQTNLLARLGPLKVEPDDVDQRDHERRRGPRWIARAPIEARGFAVHRVPAHCEASPGFCAVDSGCVELPIQAHAHQTDVVAAAAIVDAHAELVCHHRRARVRHADHADQGAPI